MSRTWNVGIVGCGFATTTFHAPLVRSTPGLKLAAVSSSNPGKVRTALPGVEPVARPEDLVARPDLDLIVVPTPNDSHHQWVAAALAAGKHVVVDKPFALDAVEAADLKARAQSAGKLLAVFQSRRWDSDFLTVRKVMDEGALGRIVLFESHMDRFRPQVRDRWRENAAQGAGLWYDLGPHVLDQALVLFGEPKALTLHQAQLRDGSQSDDWFHAVLDYGALRVVLQGSVVAARPAPRYTVYGLNGSYVKEGIDPQEDALKAGGVPGSPGWGTDPQPGTLTVPGQPAALVPGVPGRYQDFYAQMRDALDGKGPVPVSAEEGLRVMRWLDAGRLSAAEGRAVTARS